MKNCVYTFLFVFLITLTTGFAKQAYAQFLALVPMPNSLELQESTFKLPDKLIVATPENQNWKNHLSVFAEHLERITNGDCQLEVTSANRGLLRIEEDSSLAKEQYQIEISEQGIAITAGHHVGLTHATATLLQLIGVHGSSLPHLTIKDSPTNSYRNFMIDMGRNPHSLALLKETIDLLWFYKVESVQLHLTDDQRFAFPSTAFPKLWDGILTLEQLHELEAYAVARGVTIIPELEVPGHSGILRSRYPDVFGKEPATLATSEKALEGIKTLLDEMMAVFQSSPYIHIGGDEAFGVPEESQRVLINTLHQYLKDQGRKTLVWEGPRPGQGDNKVNEEVIHINWRTINYSADAMLSDGYEVINAAWDPIYLVDHYPRTNFTMTSPQHIYESLKLTRFKHVNPGIPTYANPIDVEPTDKLLGFCMPWWEGREENFFPQIVPRLIPFAEIAWNPPTSRDYQEFKERMELTERVRKRAFNPIRIDAEFEIERDGVFHKQTNVNLSTQLPGEIRYTLDGSEVNSNSPTYSQPLAIDRSITLRAALFQEARKVGHESRVKLTAVEPAANLALGKSVTSSVSSGSPFSVERVTDGGTDNLGFYLGYPAEPEPINITVDLGTTHQVNRIVVHAYTISNSFEKYKVEVSTDGSEFTEIASRLEKPTQSVGSIKHEFEARPVRFIRVVSYGNKGYVFDSFSKITEIQAFSDAP